MNDFNGKKVLVTGGTSGIGAATATLLAKMGADVIIIGRSEAKGNALVKKSRQDGTAGKIMFLQADYGLMRKVINSAETIPQLKEDFWSGDVIDQTLISYIRDLSKKYHMAIISNAIDGLRPFLIEEGIFDAFETVVISAEIGTTKPAPKIYEHCLALMGLPAEQTVFIDDFMHNIAGAHAVGMHGIHYPPRKVVGNLIAELDAMGVEAQQTVGSKTTEFMTDYQLTTVHCAEGN